MTGYVIAPGIYDSTPEHWQSLWQDGWGADAAPASWDEPDREDWIAAVDRAYRRLAATHDKVALVAHSLGCWAATEWVRRTGADTVLLLVAAPDPRGPRFPGSAASFADLVALPIGRPVIVVASDDDPYCDPAVSKELAEGWGARWTSFGDRGHINGSSGLGDWPEGRGLLASLLAS